ncbi:MAG: hypothetical protein K2K21_06505 [Lachnospiraceae bacterium]|nr:hypothetical protein [Lachnospiraceae bacterium]
MNVKVKYAVSIFMTAIMLCSLSGCDSSDESGQMVDVVEGQEINQVADAGEIQKNDQGTESENLSESASGEDLDVVAPDPADDDWYMKGSIYTDDNGRRLEVFFNDEGMIEFAIDGLSVYFTSVGTCQFENNWRIYTCDDRTMIVYYPGEPAHIEISDGDYAGLYEEGGDKVN